MLVNTILSYKIDDPESSLKFSDRLAQENMWTKEYSKRVVEEYQKFMYLARTQGNVTPSIQVDEAWHLHMIYTRDYMEFCELLGGFIHHGPTRGSKAEDDRYWDQYIRTLILYYHTFGTHPPEDIWPPASERFKPDRRMRINLDTHWVIPVGDWRAIWQVIKREIFKLKN
jgi:hypothetical protein